MSAPTRIWVAGLPLTPMAAPEALAAIHEDAAQGIGRVYILVNAHSSSLARTPDYRRVLSDCRVRFLVDGISVAQGARLTGHGAVPHLPGPDLMHTWSRVASGRSDAGFLLGGGPGVAEAVRARFVERNPDLVIAGVYSPPYGEWPDAESRTMIAAIKESGARTVWLGVSAPKQEVWAHRWVGEIGLPVICVGAAFDFHAGTKRRAPEWVRRSGFEWLHRLASEPGRLWRRYLVGNLVFVLDLIRYRSRVPSWVADEASPQIDATHSKGS